ncbi:hypothetical protein [Pseudomonas sp. F(2018)]|uniref:hypothetical protein n=1 Tax=Pseudomonas sp. F(2018) TaxID=2502240 RepID=UPI0010F556C8|nr:hypothetical protein [Pseudomonas sp. F(2018)]
MTSTWRNVALLSVGVLIFAAAKVYFDNRSRSSAGHELALKIAAEINKTAPRTIDEVTVLDRATAGSGSVVITHYTITGLSAANIDREELAKIKPAVVSQLCGGDLNKALGAGIAFEYQYRDKTGNLITAITVSRADCG